MLSEVRLVRDKYINKIYVFSLSTFLEEITEKLKKQILANQLDRPFNKLEIHLGLPLILVSIIYN